MRLHQNVRHAAICCALLGRAVLLQAPSALPSTAPQLPLSARQGQSGSVSRSQVTTNAGGGASVNLLDSSVNVQGPYAGSAPTGTNTGATLPLSLDNALSLGLR